MLLSADFVAAPLIGVNLIAQLFEFPCPNETKFHNPVQVNHQ